MRVSIPLLAAMLAAAPVAGALAATDDWVARVKRVAGEASVEVDGETRALKVGDRLPSSAVVTTGAKSGAGLTFKDNTRVSLGPNGVLKLSRYAYEPGRPEQEPALEAGLDKGMAAFVSGRVTQRKPGAMQVRTPAALLGVRGTTFIAVTGEALDKQ